MPNKTIYVKDGDVPLFESAQDELGESVSSLFAEFLHSKLAAKTPDERKVLDLIKEIRRDKKALKESGARPAVLSKYNEAEAYAVRVWKHLQNGEIAAARSLFFDAQSFHNIAEKGGATYRNFTREIGRVLRAPRS